MSSQEGGSIDLGAAILAGLGIDEEINVLSLSLYFL